MLPPHIWLARCPHFILGLVFLGTISAIATSEVAVGQSGFSQDGAEILPPPVPSGVEEGSAPSIPPQDVVREIRIVGNQTIPTVQIESQLRTRAGREFDATIVQRDVKKLATLGWFVNVKPLVEATPTGRIVVFEVTERPTVRYVNYLGNKKVGDKTLGKQTNIKSGGAVEPYAVEEGRRKIHDFYKSKGFNHVQVTILEGTKPTDQGVVYLINEGESQKIWKVSFVGNSFVSDARLKTIVKSKPPFLKPILRFKGHLDREQLDADKDLLTEYYRSYGYFQAKIGRKIEDNDDGNWVDVTFIVHEGPRYSVRDVRFMGNSIFESNAISEHAKLKPGAEYEQALQRRDSTWLQELYGSHGYVFANIEAETVFLEEPGQVDLVYKIDEGRQWRVGRVFVHIGGDNPHTRIQTALNRITLRPGDIMDVRELKASERRLMASSLYHVDAATGVRPKITYQIPEDAEMEFSNSPSQHDSVRGQNPEASGPPLLPPPSSAITATASRPAPGLQVGPDGAIHIYCEDEEHFRRWTEIEERAHPTASEEIPLPTESAPSSPQITPKDTPSLPSPPETLPSVYRGQSPSPSPPNENDQWWIRPRDRGREPADTSGHNQQRRAIAPNGSPYDRVAVRGQNPSGAPASQQVQPAYAQFNRSPGVLPSGGTALRADGAPAGAGSDPYAQVQPAQYSPQLQPPAGTVYPTPLSPQGPLPFSPLGPDNPLLAPGVPYYPEAGTVDLIADASETQTGRLMAGVGVNSDAGVVGNFVIDERNFNWRQWPRSFEDFRSGQAWRGDGQRFRLEASPGSRVNRYLLSFQEPYLLDRPISLGLSGSYFDRNFRDWDEQRLGGRVSLGYQWVERDLSATVSYRGENVNVSDISSTSLPELTEVAGDNALHGFKLTLINDTRDSPFLATQGHYLEIGGEQVIGTFDYPRAEFDFRKYFLVHERPDHSGRHVLSMSTNVGYSGTHTPIYEHFFAGGFATFRGFDFRGASPVDRATNVQVGGEFQWLNTVQYQFPITADEMLHGVAFCDFGTVERRVEIKDFRVSPGVGLRITVPAMGPAPIALDFAWPVSHADLDDRQVFTFSLGFQR